MKIVLLDDTEGVGRKGEVKEVKDGFARNYLLPKKIAITINDPRAKGLIEHKEKVHEAEKEKEWKATEQATQADGKVVAIDMKAGEKDQLFASVGKEEIIRFAKEQLGVEAQDIIGETMKTLGEYDIRLVFPYGKEANIKVVIKAEKNKRAKK